ncbi:MAG TPA: hypothetical protein VFB45_08995 [Pseudolabrys sp.]|nr:hypothetical protein [Pseudolabrys sp.]
MAVDVVFAFLSNLGPRLSLVIERAQPQSADRILDYLYWYIATHIPRFQAAHNDPRVASIFHIETYSQSGSEGSLTAQVARALAGADAEQLLRLAEVIVEAHEPSLLRAAQFCGEIEEAGADSAAIFLTVAFPTSWAPLAQELTRAGVTTFAVCLHDHTGGKETALLNTTDIPVNGVGVLDFLGHVFVLSCSNARSILVNADSYLGANWDVEKTIVLYLLTAAMLAAGNQCKTMESEIVALLYDALQPIGPSRDGGPDIEPGDTLVARLYRDRLGQFSKIVFNASSRAMGDFLERAVSLSVPRLNFYRYSSRPSRPPPSESHAGLRLVMLSPFLSDSQDAMRNSLAPHVRAICDQGLHVHYFCNPASPAVAEFQQSLTPQRRPFFHPHAIIRDQAQLVETVQEFDLGLILADDLPLLKAVVALEDVFYREATSVLWQSSIGSAPFVFAGAGIPMVCPRYQLGLVEVFGSDTTIPISLSEFAALRKYLEVCDLPRRMKIARERRSQFWIEENIQRLVHFLQTEIKAPE